MAASDTRPGGGHMRGHMNGVESLMWTVDSDPALSAIFGTLTIVDRPVDMQRLTARLTTAMQSFPRMRQRVVPAAGPVRAPRWHDVDTAEATHHLRRVALAPPGDLGQLLSLAAAVVADPLDRSRPLWQFWVIEGLSDGRAALLVKLHHTLTDGMGGVRLWEQFVDVERDGRPDDPRNLSPTPPGEDIGRDRQSPPQMLAGAVETAGRLATSVARRAIDVATDVISHPGRLPSLPGDAARATKSSLDQLVVTDRCRSPLWTGRGGPTHLRVVDADVATTRSAAHLLGGTINDLFVTAVAGAAGRYHRLRGTNVDELRMAMPVSVRHGDGTGGNAFVPTRLLVPTDHGDLATRFAATRSALRPSRSTPVLGLADAVATAVNVLPASAVVHLVRQQTASVDFTTSNVRGAPIPLYVAGSRLDATYPIGPLGGTAFNASMLSYNGTLSIGVHIDGAAVDDPDVLGELINDEFTRLVEAGNQR